jgi:iron complex outermembrane receptor protein
MSHNNARRGLFASTMIASGLMAAMPALAQDAPPTQPPGVGPGADAPPTGPAAPGQPGASPAGTADGPSDVIVVTGTRIPQPNLTSSSPVTVLNSQEAKLQGTTRVEDLINSLPQAFAAQGSAVSNGSSGTATVNLRNLGEERTLVLVNGRRLMPGDPIEPFADLNVIPASLISRVDVLTGGASSVYGSDAVAGVVNFIMDTDFTGVSLDAQYGFYNHNNNNERFRSLNAAAGYPFPSGNSVDGRSFDTTLTIGAGTDDDRGHIVGYVGYRKIAAISQARRDYSACGVNENDDGTDFQCSGSLTSGQGNFSTLLDDYIIGPDQTFVPGSTIYNANPLNYFQRPDKRYTAGFFAHYDVSDAFKPYAEFMFMDDRSVAQIAPSGNFFSTSSVNCNNPLLTAQQVGIVCNPANLVTTDDGTPQTFINPDGTPYNRGTVFIGRRNVEGGGRQADLRHTSYRVVAGAKGDIAPGISYDAYGQFGSTNYNLIYRNDFSITRLNRALDVIAGPGGVPTCRSVVDGTDPNCVPYNIFALNSVNPAALGYLQTPGFQSGETKEKIVSGSVTFLGADYGVKSPWAEEGIGLNVGLEYREETLRLEVDQAFATGDLSGQGGPTLPVSGKFNVKEAFAELRVPIVSERPFFHELTLEGGYRYSDYSISGTVKSYKGAITWAPVRDVRFRGGYNRAVRAPNVQEFFQAQSVQLDGATDPCAGETPQFTPEQCVFLGVSPAQYGNILSNPSEQYNGLLGGNLDLTPEKADTFTAGIVLQPSFLPGFNATIDAFNVKVKNLISTFGSDNILNQCGLTGDPTFCSLINRDVLGTLFLTPQGFVQNLNINAGSLKTRGIDVSASYNMRTDTRGTFTASLVGTYLDQLITDNFGPSKYECAGYYGAICGIPSPKWRHKFRLSWETPWGIGLSGQWRRVGPVTVDSASSDPDLAGDVFEPDRRIKSQNYFDLTLTARLVDKYSLRIGANNILDREPPIMTQGDAPISQFGNGNTYPTVYDAVGRFIFVGVTLDL